MIPPAGTQGSASVARLPVDAFVEGRNDARTNGPRVGVLRTESSVIAGGTTLAGCEADIKAVEVCFEAEPPALRLRTPSGTTWTATATRTSR